MNKKQLAAVVEKLVAAIATENQCDEGSARTLLGLYLQREQAAVVAAASPRSANSAE